MIFFVTKIATSGTIIKGNVSIPYLTNKGLQVSMGSYEKISITILFYITKKKFFSVPQIVPRILLDLL